MTQTGFELTGDISHKIKATLTLFLIYCRAMQTCTMLFKKVTVTVAPLHIGLPQLA